jgi:polyvinyl alcohol dehydrogenase (cytochrome)
MRLRRPRGQLAASGLVALLLTATNAFAGVPRGTWPAYLFGPTHGSFNPAATAITPSNAALLSRSWGWVPDPPTMAGQPGTELLASPTVYGGRVYIGANTGVFYALEESTGAVVWKRFLGFVPRLSCDEARGFTSTATAAPDPSRDGRAAVYVAAPDGRLYALDAGTGATLWRALVAAPSDTENDYYNWSSPTLVGGRLYVGVSSNCDRPLVRGGLKEFDQATGRLLATYWTVPEGSTGGSIWSSAAATRGGRWIYVTTGNECIDCSGPGDALAIVRLAGSSLVDRDRWIVPPDERVVDSDFGASPTLFSADLGTGTPTPMVGACNKNGTFYAFNRRRLAAGPVWRFQVVDRGDTVCLPAAVWDGQRLFVAGANTTIAGKKYQGSIRELDPATGAPLWETGLPAGKVLGTPTLDAAGVLALGTRGQAARAYLVGAGDGAIIATFATGPMFAQPVFADGSLFLATQLNGLVVYRPA